MTEKEEQRNYSPQYEVVPIIPDYPHRWATNMHGFPVYFIECKDNVFSPDMSLGMFRVCFNQWCMLNENGEVTKKRYCFIELNSNDEYITRYFARIMELMVMQLDIYPTVSTVRKEITKLINLFRKKHTISKEIVEGLWAELLVIYKGSNSSYLLRSWHVEPNDKYDFNDGVDKIEVKATRGNNRIHTFSLEQLNPNKGSELVIASVMAPESGMGKNVFDLVEMISMNISDKELILKLTTMVTDIIGVENIAVVEKMKFDFLFAVNSYKLFDFKDVPSISKEHVSPAISSVKFTVNMEGINELEIDKTDSLLIKSLHP